MYKHIILSICAALLWLPAFSQQDECYEMTQPGTSVRYAAHYKGKLRQYVEKTLVDVKSEAGNTEVTFLWKALNKKGKPSKSASLMGWGDGIQTTVSIKEGAYYLTFDLCMGTTMKDRSGYLLKIPQNLQVGDVLEGGTLKSTFKFMGTTMHNEITFKDFKVVEEVDLNTEAGTIHCMKIEGNVVGKFQDEDVNEKQTIYLAKGIGIVRQEALNYLSSNVSYIVEVSQISR